MYRIVIEHEARSCSGLQALYLSSQIADFDPPKDPNRSAKRPLRRGNICLVTAVAACYRSGTKDAVLKSRPLEDSAAAHGENLLAKHRTVYEILEPKQTAT
jgi:hypothetical protein